MSKKINIKFLICSSLALFSQINDCKAQQVDPRTLFDQAEEYLLNENYEKALPLYEKLLSQHQNNGNLNFKLGRCYLNSPTEFSKSVNFLERASSSISSNSKEGSYTEEKAPNVAYMFLGDAYHRNFRFDDAIEVYKKFKTYISEKNTSDLSYIDYKIQVCKNAKELKANPVKMIIKNIGDSINSPYADYSPIISADESILLFTSRRPENVGGLADDNGKYFEDIYVSYRSGDGTSWTKAKNMGSSINTAGHEATIGTSIDGQLVFIYKDKADSGSIYTTSMQGETWTIPEKVGGEVNSKYWEPHATLSADGNTLFFVSNRPGGFGGRDIYKCKKLPSGQWSKAVNLGPHINTKHEEDSPFLHADGTTLYFSSQGHKNMGGFDIFTSHFIDTGIMGGWTEPENIGYPVNTTGDDIFFVPTVDNKRAYYSSFAAGGLGDKDIYMLTLPEREESNLAVLRGTVIDCFGKIPIGTAITVVDKDNEDIAGTYQPNPTTGKYLFILSIGKTYKIMYEADGYRSITNEYKLDRGKEYLSTEMVFVLKEVKLEKQQPETAPGISGIVTDIQNNTVKNAGISAVDNSTGKSIGTYFSGSDGKFNFALEREKEYTLTFEAEGYLFRTEKVDMSGCSAIGKNVSLQPIAAGISGIVTDIHNNRVKNAGITVVDNSTGKSIGTYFSGSDGKFNFALERGKEYTLTFESEGYLFQTQKVYMSGSAIEKNVSLQPIVVGTKIILNNILFDFNKAKLRKESFVELDKLYSLLKEKSDIKAEISGHTDSKGSHQLNMELSNNRAKAAMDYLVKKGIDKKRLTRKGYGKTQSVAANDTDEGRQLNRRVEMKILEK